jgi:hypothetical protein
MSRPHREPHAAAVVVDWHLLHVVIELHWMPVRRANPQRFPLAWLSPCLDPCDWDAECAVQLLECIEIVGVLHPESEVIEPGLVRLDEPERPHIEVRDPPNVESVSLFEGGDEAEHIDVERASG